jgi:hypothetical protein
MKLLIPIIALLTTLSGCAKDYTLAPPADSEKVTVTIKVPKELEAQTMKVMYRSTLCTFTSRTASGVPYKREGYQKADIQPIQRGQSDLYDAKLPIDGGGACQWRLSNVTFGVAYENPSQFGEGVTYGAGGGVVVAFDHNSPSRSGSRIQVDGDLSIIKDYYPWVDEEFLGQYRKSVSLLGEGNIYLGYKAVQARSVYYEVILHSGFVLCSAGPKKKQKGNYTVYKFPDGSVVEDGRPDSTFLRMQAIRMAAEAKQ